MIGLFGYIISWTGGFLMSIFDIIAPIYGKFFNMQRKFYSRVVNKVKSEFDISEFSTILDIGCGTGALCQVIHKAGLEVTGADPSKLMLNQAKNKLQRLPIELVHINPDERLPFEDKSFDLVISSYVAHGLDPKERLKLYKEMRRIAKNFVIIHDYNENRALLTTIIEWLENGDYFNFIKVAESEMNEVFDQVTKINVEKRAAWYICTSTYQNKLLKNG